MYTAGSVFLEEFSRLSSFNFTNALVSSHLRRRPLLIFCSLALSKEVGKVCESSGSDERRKSKVPAQISWENL